MLAYARAHNTDMAYIPAGCTGLVQPGDISWNKSFKVRCACGLVCIGVQSRFRDYRDTWLSQNAHRARTAAGNETAPPIELVLQWIASAWAAVPVEQIVDSFRAAGLTANVNVVSSMTCFKSGGQLHDHIDAFTAALNEGEQEIDGDVDDDMIVDGIDE